MLAAPVYAQAKARVVVIGGGPGGATAAKYIAKESGSAIEVTLVEPTKQFTTCFHSNLYLGGFKLLESITHTYDKLASSYGIKLNHQAAVAIDRDKKQVRLADGSMLPYDRLVLRPALTSNTTASPAGARSTRRSMPHAWKAGKQTQLLKARLDAVPDGGLIVMIAPPNPYRCPPGPYERVSMMAHALKAAGKTKAKIVIIDPKEAFSKQPLFMEGWHEALPGHGRVARPEDPRGRQVGRSQDQHGGHRLRDLQGGAGQRHSRADGGQDRARCRLGQPERVLRRSIRPA